MATTQVDPKCSQNTPSSNVVGQPFGGVYFLVFNHSTLKDISVSKNLVIFVDVLNSWGACWLLLFIKRMSCVLLKLGITLVS